jgi:hypothetical protein
MIVCLRTVAVPAAERARYLAWIAEGRAVREAHGILAELVLEPPSGDGDTLGETVGETWSLRSGQATRCSTPGSPRPNGPS